MKLKNEELAIARFLALKFKEDGIDFKTEWPEDAEEASEGGYELVIEGWTIPYKRYDGTMTTTDMAFECEGQFKHREEYEDTPTLSREDFFAWAEANPTFADDIEFNRRRAVEEISRLNKVAYDAVEAAIALSEECCLPYSCRMPSSVADLDQNSDWDSSRC